MRFTGKIYRTKQSRKNQIRPDTNSNASINITTCNIDGEEFFLLDISNGSKIFISNESAKSLGYTLIDLADRANLNITKEIIDK